MFSADNILGKIAVKKPDMVIQVKLLYDLYRNYSDSFTLCFKLMNKEIIDKINSVLDHRRTNNVHLINSYNKCILTCMVKPKIEKNALTMYNSASFINGLKEFLEDIDGIETELCTYDCYMSEHDMPSGVNICFRPVNYFGKTFNDYKNVQQQQ